MTCADPVKTCAELEVEVEKKRKEKNIESVDFSVLPMNEYEISEVKRIRRQNKGGKITQRVANSLAKEFNAAIAKGYTVDELLTEWECRTWKSFKAEWIKPKQNEQFISSGLSSAAQQTINNLKDGF